MIFLETRLPGVFLIELEKREDERGYLARTWDKAEFESRRLDECAVQAYVSQTTHKGTLRGLHYQTGPFADARLIMCTRGAMYEVVADVRPGSETYGQWTGLQIKASEGKMLYVPPHCAHAILTLEDDTQYTNLYSQPYTPEFERGIRYDDPCFKFAWPIAIEHVSAKDSSWQDFD